MKQLAAEWCAAGWAAPWAGRFGSAGDGPSDDFFGLPSNDAPVYVGVGGMHMLPRRILDACGAAVRVERGVRVAGMRRATGAPFAAPSDAPPTAPSGAPVWELLGVSGPAAFHDTSEAMASRAAPSVLGSFDLVVLTDVSSSFGGWHRASAGVPDAFARRVRERVRVPLFAAMVAFDAPLRLPLDGLTFPSGSGLWFASRTQSKPGLAGAAGGGARECWTLISTPAFACDELVAEPMQDAATGAFKPQEDAYLNSGPAPAGIHAHESSAVLARS